MQSTWVGVLVFRRVSIQGCLPRTCRTSKVRQSKSQRESCPRLSHEGTQGEQMYSSSDSYLGSGWGWVLAAHRERFTPGEETAHGTHRIRSCVGLRIGPEILEKIGLLYVPGIEHNPVRCTIRIVSSMSKL